MNVKSSRHYSAANLRWTLLALLVACFVANAGLFGKAPAPIDRKQAKKMEPQTFTIDFSNLPGLENKADYHLEVEFVTIDGTTSGVGKYNIGAGTTREPIRDLIMRSHEEAGWHVKPVGTEAFVIEGYGKKKFSPIKTAVVKCPDLPQNQQPTVKRTPVVEPKKETSDK